MGLVDLEFTLHASGPVPAARAWERYDQLDLWPTWSPQLRSVSTEPPDSRRRLSAGLSGRVHGPVGLWAQFTVLAVDAPGMRWSWQVRRGPLSVHLDHQVTSTSVGSRTSLTLRGPGPVVLGYLPVAWYALHRLVSLPPA